jgi:hypothetical protein
MLSYFSFIFTAQVKGTVLFQKSVFYEIRYSAKLICDKVIGLADSNLARQILEDFGAEQCNS